MKSRRGIRAAATIFGVLVVLAFASSPAGKAEAAIYWGDGSPVGRANLDGTEVQYEFVQYEPFPGDGSVGDCGGVAVDPSHVFWAEPATGSIGRANLDGSGANYSFIEGAENPCGVAVDGGHIYWANLDGGSIGRANLDGSNVTQAFITSIGEPCGVAVDSKFIYWTSAIGHYVGRALVDTGDKGPHLIDGNESFDFCGLAVDQTHLFWGGFGDRIGRVNLDGSDPEPSFITGIERPCGIAVDGTRVYWTEQSYPGGIGAANLGGTAVNRNIVTGVSPSPCGVAVDGVSFARPRSPSPSEFDFGKVKYSKRNGVAVIPIDLPDAGYLRVKATSGASFTLLPDRVKGGALPAGGRKWLKVWAGGKGGNGRRMRRKLRQQGHAAVVVEIEFTALGHTPTIRGKRIRLVKS